MSMLVRRCDEASGKAAASARERAGRPRPWSPIASSVPHVSNPATACCRDNLRGGRTGPLRHPTEHQIRDPPRDRPAQTFVATWATTECEHAAPNPAGRKTSSSGTEGPTSAGPFVLSGVTVAESRPAPKADSDMLLVTPARPTTDAGSDPSSSSGSPTRRGSTVTPLRSVEPRGAAYLDPHHSSKASSGPPAGSRLVGPNGDRNRRRPPILRGHPAGFAGVGARSAEV